MPRLLLLLTLVAFALTSAVATPMGLCQHADPAAHAAALQSGDSGISWNAHGEETAAASDEGPLTQAAAMSLAGFMLPSAPVVPLPASSDAAGKYAAGTFRLSNRAIPPLLDPPLA